MKNWQSLIKMSILAGAMLINISMVHAQETAVTNSNPMDWYISSTEEQTGKSIAVPIWHIALEDKFGIFAYDENSLKYMVEKKTVNTDIVTVTVKTVFRNKDVIKQLQAKYAEKMPAKEKVQYWLLYMQFDVNKNMYTISKTEYYTNKNTLIDTVVRNRGMIAIPEESFAQIMYDVCQAWVKENQEQVNK